ncbi:FAD-binding oxidoreductase [Azospirillum sp. RWY-5-1]|uniref:FAD-binding oxidoreductase n=1 Tax=Azospirillum oleiclasticum TaxID=2735135 RepID=A0ABX2T9W9_9PROT|nr:FAD-binding oxidoreductase [Azospirillum oleiclasticum]NYZ13859.1 FAD-binding oxidoreductase [Azospirillum oleiclasticum]NYZ21131.1 FAD-binding oxidoreductase [Azospirillum oleiclasticum]
MFIAGLQAVLGADGVVTALDETRAFTQDWRGRYSGQAVCIALPRKTEQVAAVVRLCAQAGVPVLAQGGNTSLCGGAVPGTDGPAPVIVNLQRMRRIRSVDPASNAIRVDAGCVLAAVQRAAVDNDRLFPVSLGAEGSCQIGGAIATNAGGSGVLRYGNMRENVLGLEVVLPDGSIWDGLRALRKNNTGYDLKHLFIGSEGTLGIVTGAVLKLHPLPKAHATAWLGLDSAEAALAVLELVQAACSGRLSAFELMSASQVALVARHVPGRRCPLDGAPRWHVLMELSDTCSADELGDAMQAVLEQAIGCGLIGDAAVAASEAQRNAMWGYRHGASEANRVAGIGLTTDCAVPVSAVPAFIAAATDAVRAIVPDLPVMIVSHLGDGNVHFIPFLSFEHWGGLADREGFAARVRRSVNEVAVGLGGTFSAEHGIGQTLVAEMARYKPAAEIAMMRAVKRALDPSGLFNPGRLLP